jgi:transketolase
VAADGTVTAPELILIATGSELQLAMSARETLTAEGVRTRVVSMPSWERFAAQSAAYRAEVLPPEVDARVSIEVGASLGWERWVRPDRGAIIALDRFGMSAPAEQIFEQLGFTVDHVVEVARGVLAGETSGVITSSGGHGGVSLQRAEAAATTGSRRDATAGNTGPR